MMFCIISLSYCRSYFHTSPISEDFSQNRHFSFFSMFTLSFLGLQVGYFDWPSGAKLFRKVRPTKLGGKYWGSGVIRGHWEPKCCKKCNFLTFFSLFPPNIATNQFFVPLSSVICCVCYITYFLCGQRTIKMQYEVIFMVKWSIFRINWHFSQEKSLL